MYYSFTYGFSLYSVYIFVSQGTRDTAHAHDSGGGGERISVGWRVEKRVAAPSGQVV